jgi:HNH endonuclease
MTEAKLCIFCDNELNAETKPEHILLNGLGGRMKTREAICSDCNNKFGGSIDNTLAAQVMVIRNLLQLESGTGNAPPGLKNVAAGSDKLNFGSDGRPLLVQRPFVITERPDGNFDVAINAQSEAELQRILPHIAAKLRITEEEVKDQVLKGTATLIERRPGIVPFRLSFGSEDVLRSMVKSCLVLLATKAGSDALKQDCFAAARDFVLNGSGHFYQTRVHLDSRELPGAAALKQQFGELFNLVYVGSDGDGRVIGHFTLYNVMGWQIVLAESGGPRNESIGLISNPLDPASWSGGIAKKAGLPFGWLNTVDDTDKLDRAKARLTAMMERHTVASREAEIGRIVNDVCAKFGAKNDDDIIGAETQAAVFAEIRARLAAHAANVPYEEKLTPERLKKLLEKKDGDQDKSGASAASILPKRYARHCRPAGVQEHITRKRIASEATMSVARRRKR